MKLIIRVKKMMSGSLYCQVAVQVSSCSAKGTNWSVFDRVILCSAPPPLPPPCTCWWRVRVLINKYCAVN